MTRRPVRAADLTSLLDVLFILVFAALVQLAARGATEADVAATPPAPPDAGVPAPRPSPTHAALRAEALAMLSEDLAGRPALVAHVAADGVLAALELPDRRVELGVPLLERVPDPDVVLAYLGDRSAELRICTIAALRLGEPDLSRYLVVVTADAPLAELPRALVAGLRADAERCLLEQRGVAVVVDPSVVPP